MTDDKRQILVARGIDISALLAAALLIYVISHLSSLIRFGDSDSSRILRPRAQAVLAFCETDTAPEKLA